MTDDWRAPAGSGDDGPDPMLTPKLRRALGRLTERQRTILALSRCSGRTYLDVADLLSIPASTVRDEILIGLRNLRSGLDDDRPSGEPVPA